MKPYALLFGLSASLSVSVLASTALNPGEDTAVAVTGGDQGIQLRVNPGSPHRCHVEKADANELVIRFGSNDACPDRGGAVAGFGVSRSSWAEFHDVLLLTNLDRHPNLVTVNVVTFGGGALKAVVKSLPGEMRTPDYTTDPAPKPGILLDVGDSLYVGLGIDAGGLHPGEERVEGLLVIRDGNEALSTSVSGP